MISRNLRHLRAFLSVADSGTVSDAAKACGVSQPAVTQALRKLEEAAQGSLFHRASSGFFLTERGMVLARRVRRALYLLDPALGEHSARLRLTATTAQLRALIATGEAQNFTLAARNLGLAQPTVHRAVTQLEQEASRPLFERSAFGMVPSKSCQALIRAARLAFVELEQADAELADLDGREAGRITIGALPLSRSAVLPQALVRFRHLRPTTRLHIIDGPYDALLAGLRRGDIDFMFGALRDPCPIDDVEQQALFDDRLCILCGPDHAMAGESRPDPRALAQAQWVVPRADTPARVQFDAFFAQLGLAPPASIIEAGSVLLMREILACSDHLGCISAQQARAEVAKGLLREVPVDHIWPGRPIGLTFRAGWEPTTAQALLVQLVREAAAQV